MQASSAYEFVEVTADKTLTVQERKFGALYGLYCADSIAMPVHWMYNLQLLKRDYGTITGYTAPLDKFEGSLMSLSNTGGAGRGSDKGDIIGGVLVKGRKEYWKRGGNYHYHVGMKAGENTLEAYITRLMTRQLTSDKGLNLDNYRDSYMEFMQREGSHPDTYVATAHRMFFKNLVEGVEPKDCPDNDDHNVDTCDAITAAIPVIIQYADADRTVRNTKVMQAIRVTRNVSKKVDSYVEIFSDMLVAIINGAELRDVTNEAALKLNMGDLRQLVVDQQDPMVACYIDSNFPATLFMTYKYADSVEKALLANANAGGENVARASLLGALIGAYHGMKAFPEWTVQGLLHKDEISAEIEALLNVDQCSA